MKINTIVNRWDTQEQREGKAQRGVVTVERLAGVPKGGERGSKPLLSHESCTASTASFPTSQKQRETSL